ncbi:RcnB family protein [Ramlibacter humi]|uniref:RcnB family protein n=1 Tax=Ramlibacter humi TaxID=2530451 RepID=A0A4Z0BMY4_9BURK|nr:RcnB family protein [Ramlibacter humi]TFZ00132.1 hypothetical protein EZ216_13570 [Ramlibacter humi]
MERRTLLDAMLATAFAALGGPALAQPRDEPERRREGPPRGPDMRERRGPERYERDERRGPERDGRGPEPWRRGGRLPPEYRNRNYVVDNWRAHRLPPPPRGHEWIAVGGDYLLVVIATGVIVQVLAGQ